MTCYACRRDPAGHPGNPYSAYCTGCQPHGVHLLSVAFSGCSRCHLVFGTLESFESHRAGGCASPLAMGLIQDRYGIWQTPGGMASRERTRQMMTGINARGRDGRSGRRQAP